MSTQTNPQRPTQNAEVWANICEDQISELFDWASNRVDAYVANHLCPFESNAARVFDPTQFSADLLHALEYINAQNQERPTKWTPLPSTQRRRETFARAVLSSEALSRFLDQTFTHLEKALSRHKGEQFASQKIAQARALFLPTQQQACRVLLSTPSLIIKALSGPAAYGIVPGAWLATGLLAGERRREREEVLRELASQGASSGMLGTRSRASTSTKLITTALLSALGATLAPYVVYSLLDISQLYWEHLDAVEDLILHGDRGSPSWSLELFEPTADKEPGEAQEDADGAAAPRPGLLELVRGLDAPS